ncbi:lycopene cyclase family protein [Fodinibius sp.]|uniref:lycopene cyclase family protein n=1 Tax=Fodinibius sp. TaxID=1872440 RepID=UPI002ACE24BF|nr:lycopene cyclase family protein [Fodinibius sp.]MDZ7659269.1 lycopene cyclase family protein [Fodinibius sp.]
MQQFDYIIAGAGASGLSLAWKMLHSPLSEKKILVLDQSLTPTNDKTWCFWDTADPLFADLIYQKWTQAEVSIFGKRSTKHLNDYTYYCLRSGDFYNHILSSLEDHPNFNLLETTVKELSFDGHNPILKTETNSFKADYIFQSCFTPWDKTEDHPRHPLLQHFLGWEITTSKPVFDDSFFTLMDFDQTFEDGIAFMYLLPWSRTSALIEYTIFSDTLLDKKQYEEKISIYLNNRYNLKPIDYSIERKEFGKIPMEDRPHKPWYKPGILNLGTIGGVTKPSTGYTFKRIQKQTDAIVEDLLSKGTLEPQPPSKKRFKAYDLWLLQIIDQHPKDAFRIFNHLLKNNSLDDVFRFLAEESSIRDDLKIMNSVPVCPFPESYLEDSWTP